MENTQKETGGFTYSYCAKQQEEVKRIREKYTDTAKAQDKMALLRKLDGSVTRTAQAVALSFGIVGTLLLGAGMSLIMTELSVILGAKQETAMTFGIVIGVLGAVLASLAFPAYNAIVKAKRKKLAPEIIRLADELMK